MGVAYNTKVYPKERDVRMWTTAVYRKTATSRELM